MPQPFEIVEKDGARFATDGARTVALLDSEGLMFRRRAIKNDGSGTPRQLEWLVVELNGVRVYVDNSNLVVTQQDLYP